MYGKMKVTLVLAVVLVLGCGVAMVQASGSNAHPFTSLLYPWSPAMQSVELAAGRTLAAGDALPHAAPGEMSSWSAFGDYTSGKSQDKRAAGYDVYFNSFTYGADTVYNGTLWGLVGNSFEAKGHNGTTTDTAVDSQSFTLYMSRGISDGMAWGTSLTYSGTDSKFTATSTTESDTYVFAPYLTMMTRVDQWAFSLSPSYVLGYQRVNAPAGTTPRDDTALMGKMVLMGRASCTLSDKMSIAGDLNYNQVLHNHGLNGETDPDHSWFTTGVSMAYQMSSNMSAKVAYSTDIDSDFSSKLWTVGLSYTF